VSYLYRKRYSLAVKKFPSRPDQQSHYVLQYSYDTWASCGAHGPERRRERGGKSRGGERRSATK